VAERVGLKRRDLQFAKVEIPMIKLGKKQEIETLINEEALLFERPTWNPDMTIKISMEPSHQIISFGIAQVFILALPIGNVFFSLNDKILSLNILTV